MASAFNCFPFLSSPPSAPVFFPAPTATPLIACSSRKPRPKISPSSVKKLSSTPTAFAAFGNPPPSPTRSRNTGARNADHCFSMQKMPHAREHHGQSKPIGGGGDIRIAHPPASPDYRRRPRFRCFFHSIRKREEPVGSDHGASHRSFRLH